MTDLVTPIAIRRTLRLRLPKLRVGTSILAAAKAMGQAFDMVYVAPYQTSRRQPRASVDADLQGRDPNW